MTEIDAARLIVSRAVGVKNDAVVADTVQLFINAARASGMGNGQTLMAIMALFEWLESPPKVSKAMLLAAFAELYGCQIAPIDGGGDTHQS